MWIHLAQAPSQLSALEMKRYKYSSDRKQKVSRRPTTGTAREKKRVPAHWKKQTEAREGPKTWLPSRSLLLSKTTACGGSTPVSPSFTRPGECQAPSKGSTNTPLSWEPRLTHHGVPLPVSWCPARSPAGARNHRGRGTLHIGSFPTLTHLPQS